jgi:hypothetical protein
MTQDDCSMSGMPCNFFEVSCSLVEYFFKTLLPFLVVDIQLTKQGPHDNNSSPAKQNQGPCIGHIL